MPFRIILVLAFLFLCINCTNKNGTRENVLRFQAGRMGFKPWVNQSSYTTTATFNKAVFTQLLYLKRDFSIEPGIFTSWKWNSKDNSYTFEVDTDLRFNDGRKLDLKDIEFAILKSFLIDTDISHHQFLMDIECHVPLTIGSPFKSGMCSGLKIIEPDKIEITLKKPNPIFLYRLGELMPPVAPIEDFESDMKTFNRIPRGTGKYFVSFSNEVNSEITLTLKEKFKSRKDHTQAPTIIHFFNHGDAISNKTDLTTNAGNIALDGNKNYSQIIGQVPKIINVLDFNFTNSLGKDEQFRKAISLAIDRRRLLGIAGNLVAATGLIPSSYVGYSKEEYKYDPVEAKKIVATNFAKASSPMKPLKAFFHGPTSSPKKKYIKSLENQLSAVGLYFEFKPSSHIDFDNSKKDIVLYIYGLVTSFVDPLSPFANYVNIGHKYHNHDRNDPKPDILYKNAFEAEGKKEQMEAIVNLQKYFKTKHVQLALQEAFPRFRANKKIESIGIDDVFYTLDLSKVKMKQP